MRELLVPLAVLACPISMGLMMLFMGRGMLGGSKGKQATPDPSGDLASLKAEAARLDAKIEALETVRAERVER